jgi:tetratricopeptide (TPR) repeat protein
MKPGRPTPPTPAELERLIKAGDMAGAVRVADAMLAQGRRNLPAWLGRGCANLNLGHLAEADADLAKALDIAPGDPQANHLRAMVEQRLGRIDDAVARLVKLVDARSPVTAEAAVTLAEVYWFSHRHDELRALLAREAPWSTDPRIALARARVLERDDAEGALRAYLALEAAGRTPILRRVAGFDAVGLLDRLGRYREAFDLATRLHAELTPRFDLEGLLMEAREQSELVAKGARWITPRADPVEGVALVVGLPRSGTTLLEQMLDRHPGISGIGEYEGIDRIVEDLVSIGAWPRRTATLSRDAAKAVQARYVDGARSLARAGARVAFDKTLRAWRYLPAVAAILPGATCLSVARDPRDAAISTFLSYFHPITDGWTAGLASIRRVHKAERRLVPSALEVLEIAHERVVYERLVDDPRGHVGRVLARLGLPMDDAVLAPEANRRAVFTLSHGQVRKPINRSSIGRWRNYEFAFDGSWDALAAAHEAERAR